MMSKKKSGRGRCPCCNYRTLSKEAYGEYPVCPVCFWEDDGTRTPEAYSLPNHMTLAQGRKNFKEIGACDENGKLHVRAPRPDEW